MEPMYVQDARYKQNNSCNVLKNPANLKMKKGVIYVDLKVQWDRSINIIIMNQQFRIKTEKLVISDSGFNM